MRGGRKLTPQVGGGSGVSILIFVAVIALFVLIASVLGVTVRRGDTRDGFVNLGSMPALFDPVQVTRVLSDRESVAASPQRVLGLPYRAQSVQAGRVLGDMQDAVNAMVQIACNRHGPVLEDMRRRWIRDMRQKDGTSCETYLKSIERDAKAMERSIIASISEAQGQGGLPVLKVQKKPPPTQDGEFGLGAWLTMRMSGTNEGDEDLQGEVMGTRKECGKSYQETKEEAEEITHAYMHLMKRVLRMSCGGMSDEDIKKGKAGKMNVNKLDQLSKDVLGSLCAPM